MSDLVGTFSQVAERLECSEGHVRTLVKLGRLPHVKLGRRTLIPWRALDAWLNDEANRSVLPPSNGAAPRAS